MSLSQQESSGCVLGVDYPRPIVDDRKAVALAKERLYAIRRTDGARDDARRVVQRHGSRKRGNFRGAENELRFREQLLREGPSEEPGLMQPELF